jgi:hypothetical protein
MRNLRIVKGRTGWPKSRCANTFQKVARQWLRAAENRTECGRDTRTTPVKQISQNSTAISIRWLHLCIYWRYLPDRAAPLVGRSRDRSPMVSLNFFSDIFPSDQTMALGSTQSLVKMSTRNIPRAKGGRCVRLTTYHHTVPLSRNLGTLTS